MFVRNHIRIASLAFLALLALVASTGSLTARQFDDRGSPVGISADRLRAHTEFLADDLLEGRAPGSRGGHLAALYVATQFRAAGLQPVDGSYFQPVPLIGRTVDPGSVHVEFRTGQRLRTARYISDVVVWPTGNDSTISVAGDLVFVGYGIHAPEFGWDDYSGIDVSGKIVLVLASEPPPTPQEPTRFGGRALTYYGRWSYKLEEAARRGAAGALIVHTTESAGYSWQVVESSWTGEQLDLAPGTAGSLALAGWITREYTASLLAGAGLRLDQLQTRANRADFRPLATSITARFALETRSRPVLANNVAGLVPGRHPIRRNEYLVYTAHYDHLGIGPTVDGDSIYNGAYDNASGVAVLLELARAFAQLEPAPERSILFLATTAEEAGLLGARHYTRQPLVPLASTVANINIDGANLWGETTDVIAVGAERSSLGSTAELRARQLGLRLTPEPAPELGYYFRSDHFAFAREGIPSIYLEHGLDYRGRPIGWGNQMMRLFNELHYHRPSDRFRQDFDFSGAVQQAQLAFLIGFDVAQSPLRPEWRPRGQPPRR
jgi:Zn-dependent M28 family amino/carboxypeptidase